jgi:hypothetical protein
MPEGTVYLHGNPDLAVTTPSQVFLGAVVSNPGTYRQANDVFRGLPVAALLIVPDPASAASATVTHGRLTVWMP